MKFSEIPQFTRPGSWEMDYDIKRAVSQIQEWIKEDALQMNPDFQRGHVWTEEQQIAYLEFLFRGGKTSRVIYFNNPNWNSERNSDYKDMVCVDGLQRMTSIIRFINNEIKVFGHYYNEYEDSPRMMQGIKLNVNDLRTKKEVLQWYLEFNTGGTVHSKEEIDKVKRMIKELE